MAGRPKKEIDKTAFEKLCNLQCTKDEIAGFFDVSPDTIERWCARTYSDKFAVVYKTHSGKGKIALRRYQMHLAETNASMAIWLGKQYLGQKENPSDEASADGATIEFVEVDHSENRDK